LSFIYFYDGDINIKSLVTVTAAGEVLVDYNFKNKKEESKRLWLR
jgi:hypothetical protein